MSVEPETLVFGGSIVIHPTSFSPLLQGCKQPNVNT